MSIDDNIAGKQFGYYTAIKFVRKTKHHIKYWLCRCKCGNERVVPISMVINGRLVSCSCYAREKFKKDYTVHGQVRTPLYAVWQHMKQRCYSPNCKEYKNYGAMGVTVCEEWLTPKNFFDWCLANGWEKGKSLDKDIIPKKLGIPALIYSPEMCSIVSPKENSRCRKNSIWVEYKDEKMSISELCEKYGVSHRSVYYKIKKGKQIEEIMSELK